MSARDMQSVPFLPAARPQQVLQDGSRLDGRGFEEFRSVCEWPFAHLSHRPPRTKHTIGPLLVAPQPAHWAPLSACTAAVFRTGVISQASGSAYAEFRNTKVMVGVYGPRQSERKAAFSEQGRINCDVKLATFATRQRGKFGQVRGAGRGAPAAAAPGGAATSQQRCLTMPHFLPMVDTTRPYLYCELIAQRRRAPQIISTAPPCASPAPTKAHHPQPTCVPPAAFPLPPPWNGSLLRSGNTAQ